MGIQKVCSHREKLRITDIETPFFEILLALSEGNPGALRILSELYQNNWMLILRIDSLHLYGFHIWEVYKDVCGEDLDRFIYHIEMELPCQICGCLSITGSYSADMDEEETEAHFAARQYGRPGSYWALKNPPKTRDYDYPIKA